MLPVGGILGINLSCSHYNLHVLVSYLGEAVLIMLLLQSEFDTLLHLTLPS